MTFSTANENAAAEAARIIQRCDRILIGAGSGLSAAAGLTYSGERFRRNFAPFIERYGITDMYSAGFYPYPTEEARWAYWATHVTVNRHEPPALPLYREILDAVADKDYFVITTNVDAQFEKAGFSKGRLFATQGDYGLMQCMRGCHERTYPNAGVVAKMIESMRDCAVPSELVPRCPVCGGPMAVHLRCDAHFVEDAEWHAAQSRYARFVEGMEEHPTVLLELGVGWNTPSIIRFPFEAFAKAFDAPLIRMNYDDARIRDRGIRKRIELEGDIAALWPVLAG